MEIDGIGEKYPSRILDDDGDTTLLVARRRSVALRVISRRGVGGLALQPLLEVDFGVPLLLVAPRELSAALITAERFLAGVRSHVGGEVVAPRERAHADATLERLLARMDADVPGELVAAGEPAVATVHGASVRPLVHRRFARSIRVLARLHRDQPERQRALLVNLRENLVSLRRARIVLGQLDARRTRRRWWWLLLLLLLLLARLSLLRLLLLLLLNGRPVTARPARLLLQRGLLAVVMGMMVGQEIRIVGVLVRGQPRGLGRGRRVMVTWWRGWLRLDG